MICQTYMIASTSNAADVFYALKAQYNFFHLLQHVLLMKQK